jgi:transposase
VHAWRVSPVVEALHAWRGVPCPVAVPLVAARGDLTRVERPRERMKFRGLMPSEYASGEPRRPGAITQAGHTHARRVLVDGAWAYRDPATISRHVQLRLEHPPTVIQDIRWKAHVRRCKRYRRLVARGTHAHVVTVAMARELTGCMWAMATEVPVIASDQDGS